MADEKALKSVAGYGVAEILLVEKKKPLYSLVTTHDEEGFLYVRRFFIAS